MIRFIQREDAASVITAAAGKNRHAERIAPDAAVADAATAKESARRVRADTDGTRRRARQTAEDNSLL